MRTLEQLGISPAPWEDLGYGIVGFANRENAMIAVLTSKTNMSADARLIASAPMLYEALRELVKVTLDTYWDPYWRECEGAKERVNEAVEKAKAALAAASGESEVAK